MDIQLVTQQAAGYLVCAPLRPVLNMCRWHIASLAAFTKCPRKRGTWLITRKINIQGVILCKKSEHSISWART